LLFLFDESRASTGFAFRDRSSADPIGMTGPDAVMAMGFRGSFHAQAQDSWSFIFKPNA
jgi:hypothetical protein